MGIVGAIADVVGGEAPVANTPPVGAGDVSNVIKTPGVGTLEERVLEMERNVSSWKRPSPVQDALQQVRILASRPALTAPHVLLAAVELLVEQAAINGHTDANFYSRALRACREINDIQDLCTLCLKLFGSQEDKKITTALSELYKAKRHMPVNQSVGAGKYQGDIHNFMPPYPYQGAPFFPPHPYRGAASPRWFSRGGYRPRSSMAGDRLRCFGCRELGHVVANCTKVKKE